jgi:glycosyltransferase involved in cell wall biosynthesis
VIAVKILVFSQSEVGGSERSLLDVFEPLYREGYDITVAVSENGEMSRLCEQLGIPVIVFAHHGWTTMSPNAFKGGLRHLQNRWRANRFAHTYGGYDLVYTNTVMSAFGALVAKQMKVPHIWHFRELVDTRPGRSFQLGLEKSRNLMNATTRWLVGNSRFTSLGLEHYAEPERVRTILTAPLRLADYDPSSPLPRPPGPRDPIKLITVGTVQARKGQLEAVEALGKVLNSGRSATLSIVGEGGRNYSELIKGRIETLKIEPYVHWLGKRADVNELLRSHHVSLVCSSHDPIPRTPIEAMAMGCVCIGARSGGVPEVIDDGETGLLYELGNTDQLAQSILLLAGDPGVYESLSFEGRKRVHHRFDSARAMAETKQLISETISQ